MAVWIPAASSLSGSRAAPRIQQCAELGAGHQLMQIPLVTD